MLKQIARIAARGPALAGSSAQQMCVGNGRVGRRIRAFYGYPADTAAPAAMLRTWIKQSVATADANLDAQTPGSSGQHVRMYCRRDRGVTVTPIAMVAIGGSPASGGYVFLHEVGHTLGAVQHTAPHRRAPVTATPRTT